MMRIVAVLIFISLRITVYAQQLEAIDSVYLNTLLTFSDNANRIKENVWPGMSIGPACIFRQNGPAFLIHHPQPPAYAKNISGNIYMLRQADLALMGTTQTEINHHLTAQNHYEQSFYVSVNQFYAELFHELHHVYQRNNIKTLQFDNPVDLLTYPEHYRNDAVRQYENELLLEMLSGPPEQFQENVNKFFSCRALRKGIIGEKYLNYEKRVESAEGPATYCEYKYMKEFATTQKEQAFINKRFFYSLIEPTYGREGLRNKCLLSGMMQCLLLTEKFTNWQPEYYSSGLSLNDYFFSKFKPRPVKLPTLIYDEAKAKYFTGLAQEKHKKNLEAFHHQSGVKVTLVFNAFPEFRSFDPMHAESVNDSTTIHPTLLKLGKANYYFNAVNQNVLSVTNKQIWFVKSVMFFVPENTIQFNNNTFTCNNENINVSWRYVKQTKNGREYLVTLE